jgi:uncharacterized protein YaiE (UPF0345 family)
VKFADGTHKTPGIMMPGDYNFNTDAMEIIEVLAGSMPIRLAGPEEWHSYDAGGSFEAPANSSFDLRVTELADYFCSYV